jgi:hypothetical protein
MSFDELHESLGFAVQEAELAGAASSLKSTWSLKAHAYTIIGTADIRIAVYVCPLLAAVQRRKCP